MAKIRLSKLQKWILEKCLKDLGVSYQDIMGFFGKKYTNRKPEFRGGIEYFKKEYGKNYKKVFDVERVKQETRGGYVWHGFKVSRKPELCFTNSEKAIASRSLKSLIKKGFLIQPRKWGEYRLTKAGLLKANNFIIRDKTISFKEYQKKIDKAEKEREEGFKKITENSLELPISIITGSKIL